MVLWVLWVLFPCEAVAQQATLRAKLAQGDVLRYDLDAATEVGRAKGPLDRLEQHARLRLTVAEIDEEGVATLRGALESLSVKWTPAEGDAAAFDWKEGQKIADEAPPLAKAYVALATTPIQLTVADGRIRAADGPEKAVTAAEAAGFKPPDRIFGALSPAALPRTLGPLFSLDHEGAARKAGDSWTDEVRLPGIGAAAIKVSTARTVKSVDKSEARVIAKLDQSWLTPKGAPDPTAPAATASDQSGTADERWDVAASRLESRTQETSITWRFQMQTVKPLEATRKVHATVTLTRVH